MSNLEQRVIDMRRAFDDTFATTPADAIAMEDFLAIRVGGDPWALRAKDVSRIARAPKIVAVPSDGESVLGVAGIRGALVSVHSLAMLVGYRAGAPCRWIAIASVEDVGLAFHELEAFLRVARADVHEGVVHAGGLVRPIVDVRSVMQMIERSGT